MALDLLDIMACPACAGILKPETDTAICTSCKNTYHYKAGILDLNPSPTEEARQEMEGHITLDNQWMDSIPENLHSLIEGEQGEKLLLSLPHLTHPDLMQVPSLARLAENADDFFELLNLLKIKKNNVVIEIGAHMGWASHQLAKQGAQVIAMDISHQLALTDKYIENGIPMERVYADMMAFPVQKNVLDMVFAMATIHHAEPLEKLFDACFASLKNGGRCVFFSEPVAGLYDDSIKEAFGAEEKELGIQEHIYTIVEYFTAAKNSGFSPEVLPLSSILKDKNRKFGLFRKLWYLLLQSGIGYTSPFTKVIYPFMLRFYPKIPFPHLALVLNKK